MAARHAQRNMPHCHLQHHKKSWRAPFGLQRPLPQKVPNEPFPLIHLCREKQNMPPPKNTWFTWQVAWLERWPCPGASLPLCLTGSVQPVQDAELPSHSACVSQHVPREAFPVLPWGYLLCSWLCHPDELFQCFATLTVEQWSCLWPLYCLESKKKKKPWSLIITIINVI